MKRAIFITGRPGIGKTSVLLKAVDGLRARGYAIGGMVSREVREGGLRVGFEIIDLATGRKGWLSHVRQPNGPRVGKYRVNLRDLNDVGVNSIKSAVRSADVVIIDEVGPMELFSPSFKEAVRKAIESDKLVLGTLHHKIKDPLIEGANVKVIEVTFENRERLHEHIIERALQILTREGL